MEAKAKSDARIRRHARVRKKVQGEAARPRLAVYRSNRHIYAQLIDDRAERTLAAASDAEVQGREPDRACEGGRRVARDAREGRRDRYRRVRPRRVPVPRTGGGPGGRRP